MTLDARLGEAYAKTSWTVDALCLKPNAGQMPLRLGAEHDGAERAATMEAHAEGIVAEALQRRRGGDGMGSANSR